MKARTREQAEERHLNLWNIRFLNGAVLDNLSFRLVQGGPNYFEHRSLDKRATMYPIPNNDADPTSKMPDGWSEKFPLRDEQLRSLMWMKSREVGRSSNTPYV